MTITELNERIKEEVVLHDGDLKEWQWRRNGLLTEAEQDGIPAAEFMRLVNEVSYRVGGLFPRINALKANAESYARTDQKQLTAAHTQEIITEAERLTLSRSFVTERWLPAILAAIPDPPKPVAPASVPVPVPVSAAPVAPAPESPVFSAPAGPDRTEIRRQIAVILDSHKSRSVISASVLRGLFHAIKADEGILTEEVFSYLVSNFYKAVGDLQGNTLRERLVSTDWQSLLPKESPPSEPAPIVREPTLPPSPAPVVRSFTATPARVYKGHNVTLAWEVENLLAVTIDDLGIGLSPQNRGWVKPTQTTEYTLFDANNNALSTVRVEVIPRDRSGIYGVLFALALLGLIYWFIKNTGKSPEPYRPAKERAERTSKATDRLARRSRPKSKKVVTVTEKKELPEANSSPAVTPEPVAVERAKENVPKPQPVEVAKVKTPETRQPSQTARPDYVESTGDKPYDKVDKRTDEQGWHMAQKGNKWGYVNASDEWVIEPQFDATTPFKNNKAAVFLNGQFITINRSGEQIR